VSYIILRDKLCDIIILNVHAPVEGKTDSICKELKCKFLKYHMKILLGDFNAKVGKEGIFKPMIGSKEFM
jgi:hypothetical protein